MSDPEVFGPDGPKPLPNPALDFATLQKGDTITAELLERITGYSRTDRRHSLSVIRIQEQIRYARPELASHLRISKDALVIMRDAESESYSQRLYKGHKRGMFRIVRRRASIDESQLSPAEKKIKELNDQCNASEMIELLRLDRKRKALISAARELPEQTKAKTKGGG